MKKLFKFIIVICTAISIQLASEDSHAVTKKRSVAQESSGEVSFTQAVYSENGVRINITIFPSGELYAFSVFKDNRNMDRAFALYCGNAVLEVNTQYVCASDVQAGNIKFEINQDFSLLTLEPYSLNWFDDTLSPDELEETRKVSIHSETSSVLTLDERR